MVRAVTGMPQEAILSIITRQATTLGSESFVVNGNMNLNDLYRNVKDCWDGIYANMTSKYCKNPDEWPILFGIVLQAVIIEASNYASKESIFNTTVDVACALSKFDKESL